jgi:hypothetical protein
VEDEAFFLEGKGVQAKSSQVPDMFPQITKDFFSNNEKNPQEIVIIRLFFRHLLK